MAILCRCQLHAPRRANYVTRNNRRYVLPVGAPVSSSICGATDCFNQGRVYLSNDEVIAPNNIIGFYNNTIKVYVEPKIYLDPLPQR